MSEKVHSEHFLVQIDRLIDWAPLGSSIYPAGNPTSAGLAPAVVKMLLLARWYGMSESALLEACPDRMSFRRFLGLPLTDNTGDGALAEAFRRQNQQSPDASQKLVDAIEAQLLAKGYGIRPGILAEAMVVPVAGQPGSRRLSETDIFQPGEIAELMKRDQSLLVRSGAKMAAGNHSNQTGSVSAQPVDALDAAPLAADVQWPWGATTRLGERLIVGRDQALCPQAAELSKYPHVSRKHCELTACAVGVWVRDLNSHNGTFVNNERLPAGNAYLVDADAQIRFGPHCSVQIKLES